MMEKQNRVSCVKFSAGDAGVFDDIVDAAAGKMQARAHKKTNKSYKDKGVSPFERPIDAGDGWCN